jgi:hypothetical protein
MHTFATTPARLLALFAFLTLCFATLTGCDENRAKEVRAAFDEHMAALADGDANALVSTMVKDSLDRYANMGRLAATGTKDEVMMLPAPDAIATLVLRLNASKAELQDTSGPAIVRLMIDKGLLGRADIEEVGWNIPEIKFRKSGARAKLWIGKVETDIEIDFVEEDGRWKMDSSPYRVRLEKLIRQARARENMTQEEVIVALVNIRMGARQSDEMWKPKVR